MSTPEIAKDLLFPDRAVGTVTQLGHTARFYADDNVESYNQDWVFSRWLSSPSVSIPFNAVSKVVESLGKVSV